jgi:hypothetical protein
MPIAMNTITVKPKIYIHVQGYSPDYDVYWFAYTDFKMITDGGISSSESWAKSDSMTRAKKEYDALFGEGEYEVEYLGFFRYISDPEVFRRFGIENKTQNIEIFYAKDDVLGLLDRVIQGAMEDLLIASEFDPNRREKIGALKQLEMSRKDIVQKIKEHVIHMEEEII